MVDIGDIFNGSAQSGAVLGNAFEGGQRVLLAKAAENRALNQGAFEQSVRAGAALGAGFDVHAKRKTETNTNRIAAANVELRRREFLARRGDAFFEQSGEHAKAKAKHNLLPDIFDEPIAPVDPGFYTDDDGFAHPVPSGGVQNPNYGEFADPQTSSLLDGSGMPAGQGGIQSTLFDGEESVFPHPSQVAQDPTAPQQVSTQRPQQQQGLPPAITQENVKGLRTTWFNRQETPSTKDPDTPKGLGAFSGSDKAKITENAIALSEDVRAALGAQQGALLAYEVADGQVGYGVYEDIAGRSQGLTGRIDLNTSDRERVGVDQPVVRAWVVAQGDDTLFGNQFRQFALDIWEQHRRTPNEARAGQKTPAQEVAANKPRQSSGDADTDSVAEVGTGPVEDRVQNGTQPTDKWFDSEHIKTLTPTQRLPFFREAKKRQRQNAQDLRTAEKKGLLLELQEKDLERQIEMQELLADEELKTSEKQAKSVGLEGFGEQINPNRPERDRLRALQTQRREMGKERFIIESEMLDIKGQAEINAENMLAAVPDFDKLLSDTQKKIGSILTVSGNLNELQTAFNDLEDGEEYSRLKGFIDKWASKALPRDEETITKIQSLITATVPGLARGIFGEVGVLTDKDIARYNDLLPTVKNSRKEATVLLQVLRESLTFAADDTLVQAGLAKADVAQLRGFYDGAGVLYNANTARLPEGEAGDAKRDEIQARKEQNEKLREETGAGAKLDLNKYQPGFRYRVKDGKGNPHNAVVVFSEEKQKYVLKIVE